MSFDKYKKIFGEFAKDAEFIDKIIKDLNLNKDCKILDIGTGMGAMSTLLALNGFYVLTGEPTVDNESYNRIEEQHRNPHQTHEHYSWSNWEENAESLRVKNKIKFQFFDAQDLPFDETYFDGIFLYDALQHIPNKELVLKECIRVLKKEGVLVIIEWTEKQIEEDYKKYGFTMDLINPEDYVSNMNVSMTKRSGNWVNVFILEQK